MFDLYVDPMDMYRLVFVDHVERPNENNMNKIHQHVHLHSMHSLTLDLCVTKVAAKHEVLAKSLFFFFSNLKIC